MTTDPNQIAATLAADAHLNHFPSRRGTFDVPELGAVCLFNNNPYAADPEARDKETAKIRQLLADAKITELAYATYPAPGAEDAGYTYAMLLTGCDHDDIAEIVEEATPAREFLNEFEVNADRLLSLVPMPEEEYATPEEEAELVARFDKAMSEASPEDQQRLLLGVARVLFPGAVEADEANHKPEGN